MEIKKCSHCKIFHPIDEFKFRPKRTHRFTQCYSCQKKLNAERYRKFKQSDPFHHRCVYIASAARREKLPFDLTREYLKSIWTGECAISGVSIALHGCRNTDNHSELDRIIPGLGYVKGNVVWLSRRFNRIKGGASLEELEQVVSFLKERLKKEYA